MIQSALLAKPQLYSNTLRASDGYAQVFDAPSVMSGMRSGLAVVTAARIDSTATEVQHVASHVLNRLILQKSAYKLGFMLTDTALTLKAWNTDYKRELNLTRIDNSDPDAIKIEGNQGQVFAPGQLISYTVNLSVLGKYNIDDKLRFVVAELGDNSPESRILGTRVVVLAVSPDWSQSYSETITYPSSVLKTHGGIEQRASFSDKPLRELSYTVSATTAQESAVIDALIYAWQARILGAPEWHRATALKAQALESSTQLACDTAYTSLSPGAYVLIHAGGLQYEVSRIADMTANSITLEYPLTRSYQAGSSVVPVSFARIADSAEVQSQSAALKQARINFSIEL